MAINQVFAKLLINWYIQNKRNLPWRNTTDPYKILISEVILQQTRVAQGINYYLRFIEKFPTIFDLADASVELVLKHWQGLGYYSRALNLHHTAKTIVEKYNGKIPNNYSELIQLKGIGKYIAAAVLSIAFNAPYPVVDGNVYRVLSRFFNDHFPINQPKAFNHYQQLAYSVFAQNRPSLFNQAIMELGALVCLPKNPLCQFCPLNHHCGALKNNNTNSLPLKLKSKLNRTRYFYYLVITVNNQIIMRKRSYNDIWKFLFDFPLEESDTPQPWQSILEKSQFLNYYVPSKKFKIISEHNFVKHQLTHQTLIISFIYLAIPSLPIVVTEPYYLVNLDNLSKIAVPKVIDNFLKKQFELSK